VRVTDAEILRLAIFLEITAEELIQRCLRLRPDRLGLALAEQPDGACVFLVGNDCRVQPVKPQQCRDFPNGWNFPGFEEQCRAIKRPRPAVSASQTPAET
jgi:Fe-S-cluster containining protein